MRSALYSLDNCCRRCSFDVAGPAAAGVLTAGAGVASETGWAFSRLDIFSRMASRAFSIKAGSAGGGVTGALRWAGWALRKAGARKRIATQPNRILREICMESVITLNSAGMQ